MQRMHARLVRVRYIWCKQYSQANCSAISASKVGSSKNESWPSDFAALKMEPNWGRILSLPVKLRTLRLSLIMLAIVILKISDCDRPIIQALLSIRQGIYTCTFFSAWACMRVRGTSVQRVRVRRPIVRMHRPIAYKNTYILNTYYNPFKRLNYKKFLAMRYDSRFAVLLDSSS